MNQQEFTDWLLTLNPYLIKDGEILQIVFGSLCCVGEVYYRYPTVGNQHNIGERVFAYELYHQLRLSFSRFSQYDITGEPRKGANVVPALGAVINPDLVVHAYGSNEGNKVAIEVKIAEDTTAEKICGDLYNLNILTRILGYPFGLFICANFDPKALINNSGKWRSPIIELIRNNPALRIWHVEDYSSPGMDELLPENNICVIDRHNILD